MNTFLRLLSGFIGMAVVRTSLTDTEPVCMYLPCGCSITTPTMHINGGTFITQIIILLVGVFINSDFSLAVWW